MKKAAVVLVLVLALITTSVVLADNLSKASGAGKVRQDRSFSFNAQERKDGTVTGSGVLQIPIQGEPGNVDIHFDIDCLNSDGTNAIMTGTVTKSTVWPVGWEVWFKVVDNGEGANASGPDQMTLLFGGEPEEIDDCLVDYTVLEPEEVLLYDVTAGNVQVK